MLVRISPIHTDDDGSMQVRVFLSGNGRQAWSEIYCYRDVFREFGEQLSHFPSSVSEEVKLELGSESAVEMDYLLLRAFVHDGAGHCAMMFMAETKGGPLAASSFRFCVPTEAASLNELGKQLQMWAVASQGEFLFEGAGE